MGKSIEHGLKIGGILRIQTLECLLNIDELVYVVQCRVIDRKVSTSVILVRDLLLLTINVLIGAGLFKDKFIFVSYLPLKPHLFLFIRLSLSVLKYYLSLISHLKS